MSSEWFVTRAMAREVGWTMFGVLALLWGVFAGAVLWERLRGRK